MSIQLMVMSLDFESAGRPTTKVYNKNEITIGRDLSNDVVLSRPEVSARHARLRLERRENGAPVLLLVDLGSSNGTMIESKPLRPNEEVVVLPYQRVIIGNYLIKTACFESTQMEEHVDEAPVEADVEEADDDGAGLIAEDADREQEGYIREDEFSSSEKEREEEGDEKTEEEFVDDSDFHDYLREHSGQSRLYEEEIAAEAEAESEPEAEAESEPEAEAESEPEPRQPGGFIRRVWERRRPVPPVEEEMLEEFEGNDNLVEAPVVATAAVETASTHAICANFEVEQEPSAEEEGPEFIEDRPEVVEPRDYSVSPADGALQIQVGGDVSTLDFVAIALFRLQGKVMDDGMPLADVVVSAGVNLKAVSEEDGSFVFEGLTEGTEYRIEAVKSGYIFDCPNAAGVIESDLAVTVTATRLHTVAGRVEHKGLPLAGVQIDGGVLGTVVSGSDGSFSFASVPDRTEFALQARKQGYIFPDGALTGSVDGADVSLTFAARRTFTISGKVAHHGQPLAGVEIDGGALGKKYTDAAGMYHFYDVPEDESYTLRATKDGFVFGTRTGRSGA